MREFLVYYGAGWGIKIFTFAMAAGVSGGGGFLDGAGFIDFLCCARFLNTNMSTCCLNRFYLPRGVLSPYLVLLPVTSFVCDTNKIMM